MPAGRVIAFVVVLLAFVALRQPDGAPRAAAAPKAVDRGSLALDTVDPTSRRVIEAAIASARPEAQRLIDAVDGYTTIVLGRPPNGALGTAGPDLAGGYLVVLDLGSTMRSTGARGATRLVLHELGHVVDMHLLSDELRAQLDGLVPPGLPCPAGSSIGSCAPREERFAETFAKWAMHNDIGADLYIGYAVPPPLSFDAWAAPLAGLAA